MIYTVLLPEIIDIINTLTQPLPTGYLIYSTLFTFSKKSNCKKYPEISSGKLCVILLLLLTSSPLHLVKQNPSFSGRLGTFRCLPVRNRSTCIIHSQWVKSSSASLWLRPLIFSSLYLPPTGRPTALLLNYLTHPHVWAHTCEDKDSQSVDAHIMPMHVCKEIEEEVIEGLGALNISYCCSSVFLPTALCIIIIK